MITAQVGALAYRLQLPESMCGVHPVFHVSMLRKYLKYPEQKIEAEPVIIQQNLTMDCHQCAYWIFLTALCGIGPLSM